MGKPSEGIPKLQGSTQKKSIFTSSFCRSCSCDALRPSSTTLQSLQGCFPSKVFWSPSENPSVWLNWMAIPTQATDCSKAQCPPVARTSAATTSHLLNCRSITQDIDASAPIINSNHIPSQKTQKFEPRMDTNWESGER